MQKDRFKSAAALLEHDARSPMPWEELDDALWLLLAPHVQDIKAARRLPAPMRHWLAARYMEWEVGNGGFAQAAFNIPQWFAFAAEGYEAMGKPQAAALIREAMTMLPAERRQLAGRGLFAATIGRVFDHFKTSDMRPFDGRIEDVDWWTDQQRMDYVRRQREAFAAVR